MPFDTALADPWDPDSGEAPLASQAFWSPGNAELDPGPICARLVAEQDEFLSLREGEASILFLMRVEPKVKGGRPVIGEMCLPRFTGTLGAVALWLVACACDGIPDFIMVLDAAWWTQATPLQREALIFHELLHGCQAQDRHGEPRFTPEGKPVWDIRAHDLEVFNREVSRYGAWKGDITAFLAAARAGSAV